MRADWVVTSSIALDVVEHLMEQGKKVLWAPDKHLGAYIQKTTGADMLLWDAACIVHEEFKARGLADMRKLYPDAAILAHPESPSAVLEVADAAGGARRITLAGRHRPLEEAQRLAASADLSENGTVVVMPTVRSSTRRSKSS